MKSFKRKGERKRIRSFARYRKIPSQSVDYVAIVNRDCIAILRHLAQDADDNKSSREERTGYMSTKGVDNRIVLTIAINDGFKGLALIGISRPFLG